MTPYEHWSGEGIARRENTVAAQIAAYETIQIRLREAHRLAEGETESGDLFEEIMQAAEDLDAGIDTALYHLRQELDDLQDELTRRERRYYEREE